MIERTAGGLRVTVPMVVPNAAALLASGLDLIHEATETVDLSAVAEADSSALAVMLGWLRAAAASGRELAFSQPPAGIQALADLYGISTLLPLR